MAEVPKYRAADDDCPICERLLWECECDDAITLVALVLRDAARNNDQPHEQQADAMCARDWFVRAVKANGWHHGSYVQPDH